MAHLNISDSIKSIDGEEIELNEPFIDYASRFASIPGTVLLLSGGIMDCARYHIMGICPWLSVKGRHHKISIKWDDQDITVTADPFDTLNEILNIYQLEHDRNTHPIAAGLMGYLAYDLKDRIEILPRTSIDDLQLPHICLFAPSIILVHEIKLGKTRMFRINRSKNSAGVSRVNMEELDKIASSHPVEEEDFWLGSQGLKSNYIKQDYMAAVERIREYIASGHVYQVNLSQRFQTEFYGNPFHLFKKLFHMNPAPFFAYVNAGDHHIVSTSPERFLLREGSQIEARPIKGTRPRGDTPDEDRALRDDLLASRKDDAELSMIVDLLRNDIGKVCSSGSVRVAEHKRLEAYENVYHLVSIVKGKLANNRNTVDLLRATFPGGSITGCPKIRSMEIIDELEPHRRHAYTGSIGYISFHDTMDLSIAIRTEIITDDKLYFSVGGGIVYDSDPVEEYDETLHKGKTLMEAFKQKKDINEKDEYVWIDGVIKSVSEASVPFTDLGFQYGYGFFETIRVDKGKPGYLAEHIKRFNSTWEELFGSEVPDITWDHVIDQVVSRNGLLDNVAAVKIITTWGSRLDQHRPAFIVSARPYIHRLEGRREQGLRIATYPEPRQTPLASHKTMNYLYYYLAGKWAKENNADEAVIMNPDGSISETNTANILFVKGKTVIKPLSPHVLPGVMLKMISKSLPDMGYEIRAQEVRYEEIISFDECLLSNSLMGAVPVLSIDNVSFKKPSELSHELNRILL